jgi:UDP-N-acetylglucosamine 1-carboxyvinyltransferase
VNNFYITGGRRLEGVVNISGSKNAVLPILAATILADTTCFLDNVPDLLDVEVMKNVLLLLGAKIEVGGNSLSIKTDEIVIPKISEELAQKMRASNLVMGPLLAKHGSVKVPYPGGCSIGNRPMDIHIKGLSALGARFTEKSGGYIEARADALHGAKIHLDFPSVGATENIMMAASIAQGTTVIFNAAREPEINDLQNFLNAMGADIQGAGTDIIIINGVKRLKGCRHSVIPDRIEAGTFMAAAAITGGRILLKNTKAQHLESFIAKLEETGVDVKIKEGEIEVIGRNELAPVDFTTMPYPGFPTDLQAPMMSLLAIAQGTSIIKETIFEKRYQHVGELVRMGANIKVEDRIAVIKGVKRLSGARVAATDLRAGAALVLAGLAAEGCTVVEETLHIHRGYEKFVEKIKALGGAIEEEAY